ncbi:MAG: gamma-glutamylcyclotransferase [Hyphomicrobium sp.]|jgi:cation transport protein ChaC
MSGAARDIWIFGYGSLMWQPGFAYAEAHHARLDGYHRAFCIYSVHYRGSTTRPGLVLGLDRGGMCEGIAFRLETAAAAATLAYLRRRELIYGVYREARLPIELLGAQGSLMRGERLNATTFIAERAHPAYTGRLSLARQVELIRGARGIGGTNLDYVLNTLAHLDSLSIAEHRLARIRALAGSFAARGSALNGARPRALALSRNWANMPIARPRVVRDNRFSHRAKIAALHAT